jgi:tripartite-type tricarboxylate transporter receptor subunit TctC
MIKRRDLVALGLAAVAAPPAMLRPVFAKSKYPNRPIKLVIPFPPGAGNDVIGRLWADSMKPLLGTVVVENVAGGAGSLGAASVARAKPDGYTLLLGGTNMIVTEALLKKRPLFDPLKDLVPISNVAISAYIMAVNPALPVRTLKELVDYASANPRKLSYGTAGVGSLSHLTGEMFKSLTKTSDIIHVPYRGGGPAITDTMSGQISMVITPATAQLLELHQSGKLRIIAVTTPGRLYAAPDIPTAVEGGVPDMVSFLFMGVFAPRGTPKAIIDQIGQATHAATAEPAFQKTLQEAGFRSDTDSTPEKLQGFIEYDMARWGPIVKQLGLKID